MKIIWILKINDKFESYHYNGYYNIILIKNINRLIKVYRKYILSDINGEN